MIVSYQREIERLYKIRDISSSRYGCEHVSWTSKLELKEKVDSLFCATTFQVADTLDELTELNPKQSFVLKPEKGSANRGVFVCVLDEDGRYREKFSGKTYSFDEIIGLAETAVNVRGRWYMEQYLGKTDNWEFYCFDGEIGLIRQRRQVFGRTIDGRSHKHYLPDWTPLGKIQPGIPYDLKMVEPKNPGQLSELASNISRVLPYVFCRIDLYETDLGCFYGETTMHPGLAKPFEKEIDRKLGQLWLEAKARRGEE